MSTIDGRQTDLPAVLSGRYRVLGEIGRGSMGRVLRVEHLHTGEPLALKLILDHRGMDPATTARFRREMRASASIRSEHVVRVTDAGFAPELDGAPFLVMELLRGETLASFAARRGPLPREEVVTLLRQVARGLEKVHLAGLVHRDLKPQNIFLHEQDDRVVVKLLDFGLVKPLARDADATLTHAGVVLGTPLYMSPEQAWGDPAEVGPAADIWSVGLVAFELLTGRRYWQVDRVQRLLLEIERGAQIPPSAFAPALPPTFDAWFLRSCHRDPEARWPSAEVQWRALADALGVQPTATPPPSAPRELGTAPTLTAAGPAEPELHRQRRQVTVLSYEMVPAAAPATETDPEDYAVVEARYRAELDAALGDLGEGPGSPTPGGRFVVFGYPHAYGDDARRAVETGLKLVQVARELDAACREEGRPGFRLRVGIHTGVVLVTPAEGRPSDLSGPVFATATELGRRARTDEVRVSADTWRLVRRHFRFEPVDTGGEGPDAFRVLEPDEERAEADGAALPMVGRNAELEVLLSCWEEVREGSPRIVLVTGEAGIGKSRLVRAFREALGASPFEWLECACSPYFRRSAFHPLVPLLRAMARSRGDARLPSGEAGADWIEAGGLVPAGAPPSGARGAGPPSTAPDPDQLSPLRRRQIMLEGMLALLRSRADAAPVCLVVEDLHWADPSTLELIDRLATTASGSILTILTARTGFRFDWTTPTAVIPLQLRRVSSAQAAQLVAAIDTGRSIPPEVLDRLVKRTAGIPLYVEEFTRLLLESEADAAQCLESSSDGAATPMTLRDSLNARLDLVGDARWVAQLAAVLGQQFDWNDLCALWTGRVADLEARLDRLVRNGLVRPVGPTDRKAFVFHHGLLRDAAYESLPRDLRRALHGRAAEALAARSHPEQAHPELLAHHLAEAGRHREAAERLLEAWEAALHLSANAEALAHLQRAIDLLGPSPATPEERKLAIRLRTLEGMAWVVSRGYGVPEVESAFARAMEQVRALGTDDAFELLPALWGQWMFALVRGRFVDALSHGERLLRHAERVGDAGAALLAHLALGTSLMGRGRLEEARERLEAALRLYDPEAHAAFRFLYGQDPAMFGKVFLAWVRWMQGWPDHAAQTADAAVEHALGLRHPNSLGFALAISALVHQARGEPRLVAERAARLLALSTEQGWVQWLGHARLWEGAALAAEGRLEEGIARMREGRGLAATAGERSGSSHYDALLVDALCRAGLLDEAQARIAEIRAFIEEGGERAFEAEVDRLDGEIARLRGDRASAVDLFERARAKAAANGARAYELRAATSLAGLDPERGRAVLRDVYETFTEGLDTADLRAARRALEGRESGDADGHLSDG